MRVSFGSKAFDFFNIMFLILFSLATLYPFWDVLQTSLSDPNMLTPARKADIFTWIQSASVDMYFHVWKMDPIRSGFYNSIIQTLATTVFALAFNTFAAYPLAKKRLYGRNYFTIYFAITIFFSGGLIPSYLLIRGIGLYDSLWAIIIPSAFSVWHMIMMRTFFQNIPDELEEAAQMEGANDLFILIKVYMPLSKALYATMALFFVVEFWNSWFPALIYLQDRNLHPLQLVLRNLLFDPNSASSEGISAITPLLMTLVSDEGAGLYKGATFRSVSVEVIFKATIMIIATLPLIIIYPFVQKYFIKGVMVGSIKG